MQEIEAMNYTLRHLICVLLSASISYTMQERELKPLTPTQHEDRGWIEIIEIARSSTTRSPEISNFFQEYVTHREGLTRHVFIKTTIPKMVDKYIPNYSHEARNATSNILEDYYRVAYYTKTLQHIEVERNRVIQNLKYFTSQLPGKQE